MGTLRGNECAGVSNLQGLQVMLVKNNEEKHGPTQAMSPDKRMGGGGIC